MKSKFQKKNMYTFHSFSIDFKKVFYLWPFRVGEEGGIKRRPRRQSHSFKVLLGFLAKNIFKNENKTLKINDYILVKVHQIEQLRKSFQVSACYHCYFL